MSPSPRTSRASTADYEAAIYEIADRGIAAIRGSRAGIEDAVADARARGRAAMRDARDIRDSVADGIIEQVRTRPYTTLAIAGLIGFAIGALRR